jgi:hypothetical protein
MERRAYGAEPPARAGAGAGTCAHCSDALGDAGLGVTVAGDDLHRHCWLALLSEDVPFGRSLVRQSRELIDRARSTLDHPPPRADSEGDPPS